MYLATRHKNIEIAKQELLPVNFNASCFYSFQVNNTKGISIYNKIIKLIIVMLSKKLG